MKLILSPVPVVDAFYPPFSAAGTDDLRLTTHCIKTECEDGVLLFHTLSGALVLLEGGETVDDARQELVKLHFLVGGSFDENYFSRDMLKLIGISRPVADAVTSYTIFTTTDCNARCFYCYEKGIRRFSMSDATAHDVSDHIIRSCKGRRVSLNWFGGEPLVNSSAIDMICAKLKEAGIPYSSSIITNGYLFDRQTVSEASKLWNLKSAHITLDGTKEVYLRTKSYVNGDPQAFGRVLGNIEMLAENGVSVLIRLNMNSENYEDLLRLCGLLGERFGGKRGIKVTPVLLRRYVSDVRPFATPELAAAHYNSVREKLRSLGLLHAPPLEPSLRLTACMADSDESMVIHPDGTLGKCEHYSESEVVGSIYGGSLDSQLISSWKQRKGDLPICAGCPIYPRCIRLEKCPNDAEGCTPAVRQLRIDVLTERVITTYLDRKE